MVDVFSGSDVTDVLPRLQVPTIVLHPGRQQWVSQELAARTAALIPNGRLVVLESREFFGDTEAAEAIERLVAEAQAADNGRAVSSRVPHNLSPREVEVLRLIASGRSNKEIAAELTISLNTVTRHVSNIYDKAGVANRAQAVTYAREQGLV